MAVWQTTPGRRADLEALEVNDPIGYIGSMIFPTQFRNKSTGKLYYVPTPKDSGTAQTGRDPQTGTITRNFDASANTDFSCSEIIYRASCPMKEIEDSFGIDACDEKYGRKAKRGLMRALEAKKAAKLYTGDKNAVAKGGFIDAVIAGAEAVRWNVGQTALVLSLTNWKKVQAMDEVISRLKLNGFNISNPTEVLSIDTSVVLKMLQSLFKIDRIVIGDDLFWHTADNKDFAAVVKLPPQGKDMHEEFPILGSTITYMLGGDNQDYIIEAGSDNNLKVNDYDAIAQIDLVQFNAEAKYLLSGMSTIDAGETPTDPDAGA